MSEDVSDIFGVQGTCVCYLLGLEISRYFRIYFVVKGIFNLACLNMSECPEVSEILGVQDIFNLLSLNLVKFPDVSNIFY